jgi:hypothetical protein
MAVRPMIAPCSRAGTTAAEARLTIYQGDDYSAVVEVYESVYSEVTEQWEEQPADLTGYTARAQIRKSVADAEAEVSVEISCTVVSPRVVLTIPHAVTENLIDTQYVWDLELTSPQDIVTTILAGEADLVPEVTR